MATLLPTELKLFGPVHWKAALGVAGVTFNSRRLLSQMLDELAEALGLGLSLTTTSNACDRIELHS